MASLVADSAAVIEAAAMGIVDLAANRALGLDNEPDDGLEVWTDQDDAALMSEMAW